MTFTPRSCRKRHATMLAIGCAGMFGFLAAGSGFADTSVTWCGAAAPWSSSTCWGLADPLAPNNGTPAVPLGPPEWVWHVTVPSTGPVLTLDMDVTLATADLSGWINVPGGSSFDMTIEDTLIFDADLSGQGTVTSLGDLFVTNGAQLTDRFLINHGDGTQTGDFAVVSGGVLGIAPSVTNSLTGTLELFGDGRIIGSNAPAAFLHNDGLLSKSGGGKSELNLLFNSPGPIVVFDGTLAMRKGSASSSIFVDAAGTAEFASQGGDVFDLNAGATISGPGDAQISSGTMNSSAIWTIDGTTRIVGGTANFVSPAITSGFEMTGGTLLGDVTATGAADLSGGLMVSPGTTIASGGGTIGHAFGPPTVDGRALLLDAGHFDITGLGMNGTNGATLTVGPGATVDFLAAQMFSVPGGATIHNQGAFTKLTTNITSVDYFFWNEGVFDAAEGQVHFPNGYTQTAGSTVLSGGSINGGGTYYVWISGGLLTGSGNVVGHILLDGRAEPGGSAGTIAVTQAFDMGPTAVLSLEIGGTIQGSEYDSVEAGWINANGELEVSLINGFESSITNTDVFVVMDANAFAGAFTNVAHGNDLETVDGTGVFTVYYGVAGPYSATQVVLTNYRSLCPADLNGDADVNVLDLLDMLAAWGPNPGHAADLNGDGTVNVLDLLDLLSAWGAC